jgi:hypothetical protein
MQQPTLAQVATQMIQQVVARGQQPIMFVMNANTALAISNLMIDEHKKRMSLVGRFWFWLRKMGTPPRLESLHGLPVMISPHMQDGGIWLQSAGPVSGVPVVSQPAPGGQVNQQSPPPEFVQRQAIAQADGAAEEAPSLAELSKATSAGPSVSDILIKALENVEDLKQVVVIRVHHNDDVDLSLNCNQFEASGVLQKAHQWLMMWGY